MKKVTLFLLGFAAVAFMSSCGGSKSTTTKRQKLEIPCDDKAKSDATYFRASGQAKSPNQANAKDKALLNAKSRLAASINTKIKSVTESYTNEMDAGGAQEFNQTFENMTRAVVSQTLVEVDEICSESYPALDGNGFDHYVALQVSKDAIYNGIDKGISKDKKLEVMYDRQKFKEKFDEEMAKME